MDNVVEDMGQFGSAISADGPLIGLDLGTKTIGIAVSDVRRVVASPLATLKRRKTRLDAKELEELAIQRNAVGFILGFPKNMNGTEGPRCQATRAFGKALADATGLPVGLWDERLSSVAAERSLLEGGLSRRKRAEVVNHIAASIILQGALDRLGVAGPGT